MSRPADRRRAPSKRGGSTFGRGHSKLGRSRLFAPTRSVVVKARIARHSGRAFRAAPLSSHLSYLKREGVSRDGEKGVLFDADTDRADDRGFVERCQDDRHHFRFIVSPEDAADIADLKDFTRDLVKQMDADLGTKLDWVAVDHWNTDNPHVHLLVRGIDQTGADLVISRDHISTGLRSRAEDLVGIELGPKPEHEIRSALEREMTAGKPLVVTEFGSTTFEGAGQYGAGGFQIVDYTTQPPSIPERFVRSEAEQGREIVELLSIFEDGGRLRRFRL